MGIFRNAVFQSAACSRIYAWLFERQQCRTILIGGNGMDPLFPLKNMYIFASGGVCAAVKTILLEIGYSKRGTGFRLILLFAKPAIVCLGAEVSRIGIITCLTEKYDAVAIFNRALVRRILKTGRFV